MAWERGYYYRVRRENGRVAREYVGRGPVAELSARLDELAREKDRHEKGLNAETLRNEKAKLDALDADIEAMIETTDLLARGALEAAGYHQHKRGEWRKRRDRPTESP